ncbi:hypothetical protein [Halobacillus seohaensis]|uniref:Uncharacterized protein n=1 Tax=Halobacillus seohaensis TaxID=447421 RepID=A0ABW2ERD9_9BACI
MSFVYLTPSPAETIEFQVVFKREKAGNISTRLFVAGNVFAERLLSTNHFFELYPETSRLFTIKADEIYLTEISELFGGSVADQLYEHMEVV